MGVKNLWEILSLISEECKLDVLTGEIVAIDTSIWLNQLLLGLRDTKSINTDNLFEEDISAFLSGFLARVSKLLFFGAKPVFVYDGKSPSIKRKTIMERINLQKEIEKKSDLLRRDIAIQKLYDKALKGQIYTEEEDNPDENWDSFLCDTNSIGTMEDGSGPENTQVPTNLSDVNVEVFSKLILKDQIKVLKSMLERNRYSVTREEDMAYFADTQRERLLERGKIQRKIRDLENRLQNERIAENFGEKGLKFSKNHDFKRGELLLTDDLLYMSEKISSEDRSTSSKISTFAGYTTSPNTKKRKLKYRRDAPPNINGPKLNDRVEIQEEMEKRDFPSFKQAKKSSEEGNEVDGFMAIVAALFNIEDEKLDSIKYSRNIDDSGKGKIIEGKKELREDTSSEEEFSDSMFVSVDDHEKQVNNDESDGFIVESETDNHIPVEIQENTSESSAKYSEVVSDRRIKPPNTSIEVLGEPETVFVSQNDNSRIDDEVTVKLGGMPNTDKLHAVEEQGQPEFNQKKYEKSVFDLENEMEKNERLNRRLTDKLINSSKDLLRLMGIPVVESPWEADMHCALLNKFGKVDAIVTEDSDVFLFGAKKVFRKVFNNKNIVKMYRAKDIHKKLGLKREHLIYLAYLLGSDYTSGVGRVGVISAMELTSRFCTEYNEFGIISSLKSFRAWAEENNVVDAKNNYITSESFEKKYEKKKRRFTFTSQFPKSDVVDSYYMRPFYSTGEIDAMKGINFEWKDLDEAEFEAFAVDNMALTIDTVRSLMKTLRARKIKYTELKLAGSTKTKLRQTSLEQYIVGDSRIEKLRKNSTVISSIRRLGGNL